MGITTRRARIKETAEQKAARLHDDFERRLDSVKRIEAALPTVQEEHRAYLQETLDRAEREHPLHLERLAGIAEGYLQESARLDLSDAAAVKAVQDEVDGFYGYGRDKLRVW